jgi:predicted HTH transcriptional regulator
MRICYTFNMTDEGQSEAPEVAPEVPVEAVPEVPVPEIARTMESADVVTPEVMEEVASEPQESSQTIPAASPVSKQSAGAHMRSVVRSRKTERLEKIMQLAREWGTITNKDVQLRLQISDSTATRYLNELVKQARLKRTGIRAGAKYEAL